MREIGAQQRARTAAPAGTTTTVLIADDHPLYLGELAAVVRAGDGLELVAEAEDGHVALSRIRAQRPDVAVVDARLPGLDGVQLAQRVAGEALPTRVVCLSDRLSVGLVQRARAAGAAALLGKGAAEPEIRAAIALATRRPAAAGEAGEASLVSRVGRFQRTDRVPTDRELEVLALVADGLSAAAIGQELHVSEATVKTHLKNTYEKLGVKERAAAVATAFRSGLLR